MTRLDELAEKRLGLKGRGVTHDVVAGIAGAERATVTKTLNDSVRWTPGVQIRRIMRAVDLILAVPEKEFIRNRERELIRITRELDQAEKAEASPGGASAKAAA